MLSKTNITASRQCSKRLWLELNKPNLREIAGGPISTKAREKIVDIAQQIFASEILYKTTHSNSKDNGITLKRAMPNLPLISEPVLNAPIEIPGMVVLADLLYPIKEKGVQQWDMVTVKVSTQLRSDHLNDIAIRTYVADKSHLQLRSSYVAWIDKDFVYQGDGKYKGILRFEDLTDDARARSEEVESWIEAAQGIASLPQEPSAAMGRHCKNPTPCPFRDYCTSIDTTHSDRFEFLPRLHWKKRKRFQLMGIERLEDIPPDQLSNSQRRVQTAHLTGEPFYDRATATQLLSKNPGSFYFLDFETVSFVLPIWEGTRPYEAIPFQYSLHNLELNGQLKHRRFLDLSGHDPRRAIAEQLINDCGRSGAVYVYSASVEGKIIERLESLFPDLAKSLKSIRSRIIDLLPIVERCYYHPSQKGSWSLKAVIEPMTGLSYRELDGLKVGTEASAAYFECIDPSTTQERIKELRQQLLAYCALDTLATVRIRQFLIGDLKNHPPSFQPS